MTDDAFRILVVCTANMCRSPMIEHILAGALREQGVSERVSVSSAGTWHGSAGPVHPLAEVVLNSRGLSGVGFTGRPLRPELVHESDLVLTATCEHRNAAVTLYPQASTKTFTVLEFARLLAALPDDIDLPDEVVARGEELVRLAALHRSVVPYVRPQEYDLPDPIGEPQSAYESIADRAAEAVAGFVELLADNGSSRAS
jgi:protein-tyrosine phosphatase